MRKIMLPVEQIEDGMGKNQGAHIEEIFDERSFSVRRGIWESINQEDCNPCNCRRHERRRVREKKLALEVLNNNRVSVKNIFDAEVIFTALRRYSHTFDRRFPKIIKSEVDRQPQTARKAGTDESRRFRQISCTEKKPRTKSTRRGLVTAVF